MKERLVPCTDRVIIRPQKAETMSKGGIALPERAQQEANRGEVLAIGPCSQLEGGVEIGPTFEEGDEVVYTLYGATPIETGDEKLLVMSHSNVLCVVSKN